MGVKRRQQTTDGRRWPRAWRVLFLIAAALACWAVVIGVVWVVLRR